jgi:hypothetical protein
MFACHMPHRLMLVLLVHSPVSTSAYHRMGRAFAGSVS